jgi:hypothetical protein
MWALGVLKLPTVFLQLVLIDTHSMSKIVQPQDSSYESRGCKVFPARFRRRPCRSDHPRDTRISGRISTPERDITVAPLP